MKVITLLVACSILCGCGGSVAQTLPDSALANMRGNVAERQQKGQEFLTKYTQSHRNTKNGPETLSKIHAYGLQRTADNVEKLRAQLASKVSKEERVWLIRILSQQYTFEKSATNEAIASDLRVLANSEEQEIALAAVLAYSRLDYKTDKRALLLAAKNKGVIDEDGYYGELAHSVPFSPATDQVAFLKEIKAAKNRYAAEILAMNVNNRAVSGKLQPEAKEEIANVLQGAEPTFSQAIGQFDFVEAVRYAEWLRAITAVRGSAFNKQGAELIMTELSGERVDPRKILAVLTSGYASQLVTEVGQRSRFESLLHRISHYSKQHPQNRDVKEAVEQAKAVINTVN